MKPSIGLTGGIGSGKSTVARVFQQLGIPIFIADDESKLLLNQDPQLITEIKELFGEEVYNSSGELNRKALADLVFSDPKLLAQLNALVHPAVAEAFEQWRDRQTTPYVIKEAALLFESGSHQSNLMNVVVTAPDWVRLDRVIKRDGFSEEQVRARINNQLPEEQKIKLADALIVNDGIAAVIPQVVELHQRLLTICI